MTTTEHPQPVLAAFASGRGVITAEYHERTTPYDHGMRYSLHVEGGPCHDVLIHCPTEQSVIRLFDRVVRLYKYGIIHFAIWPLSHLTQSAVSHG